MSRSEKAIFTAMCMVYDEEKILVLDRKKKDWPGITFPGGHIEKGESFVEGVKREVLEETGLEIENPEICGIKQFQTTEDERYVVIFFKTNIFRGELKSSDEGRVFWIDRKDLGNYKLAKDFDNMYKVFVSEELSEFYYKKVDGKWTLELL